MTQQTTAERIRNLIFDAIQDSNHGEESTVAAPLGATIAAEIDALIAERDDTRDTYAAQGAILAAARYEAGRLGALLGEVKAENEQLRAARHQSDLDWMELRKIEQSLRAEVERLRPAVDALTRERDEARAERAGAQMRQIAAQAEVERLRVYAEAWDKREALVAASKLRDADLWGPGAPNLDRYRVTKSAWLVAEEAAETAAARAREATKEKP